MRKFFKTIIKINVDLEKLIVSNSVTGEEGRIVEHEPRFIGHLSKRLFFKALYKDKKWYGECGMIGDKCLPGKMQIYSDKKQKELNWT